MGRNEEIVVVGMGTINPLGLSVDDFWPRLIAGETSAGPVRSFDASRYCTQSAHEVSQDFDPRRYMDRKLARRQPRSVQFLIAAFKEAIEQAFGDREIPESISPLDRGVLVGTCLTHIPAAAEAAEMFYTKGPTRVKPTITPRLILSFHSGQLAELFQLQGPSGTVDAACASGVNAIREACLTLLAGEAQLMFACGVDVFAELLLATFDRTGGLSRMNESPGCRPFDRDRDGFSPGEGAAVLVLMLQDLAKELGVTPLARIAGWALSNDAFHRVAPRKDGAIAAETMRRALKRADLPPEAVDYVNTHGTGTRLNDPAETRALRAVFGEHIKKKVKVGGTKGATGHLLGGAGVLEALICVKAILENTIPPTTNLKQPDLKGGCDLDYVREAVEADVQVTLSNSFGFGGHNGSLVLTEV